MPPATLALSSFVLDTHSLRCGLEEYRQLRRLTFTFVHSFSPIRIYFMQQSHKAGDSALLLGGSRVADGYLLAHGGFCLGLCSGPDCGSESKQNCEHRAKGKGLPQV